MLLFATLKRDYTTICELRRQYYKVVYNNFNIAFKPVSLSFHTRRLRQRLKKARESAQNLSRGHLILLLDEISNFWKINNWDCILASVLIFFLVSTRPSRNFRQWTPCSIGFFSYASCFCTFCFWCHCLTSLRSPAWAVEMKWKFSLLYGKRTEKEKGIWICFFLYLNNYYLFCCSTTTLLLYHHNATSKIARRSTIVDR